ncbi:MAG: phosphatase PAP2 family protein [Elusimicrobia bacterium]|nr:phosphatase PAP2 family protein [Elusimicrobiota bacterium]
MGLTREDRWLGAWLAATFALAAALCAANRWGPAYTGAVYFPRLTVVPLLLAFNAWLTGARFEARDGAAKPWLTDLGAYALAMLALAALVQGIQYTPSVPIDPLLLRWDRALGWDTAKSLDWVAARPALRWVLTRVYESTDLQLALAPLLPLLAGDRRRSRVFLHAMVYATLLGCVFYRLWPSSGPASMIGSPHFPWVQRATYMKYSQVHSWTPVTTVWGGMIAFPSFHVAWAALTVYAAAGDRRALWPAAALNAAVIASTLILGWHYLVDLPAGLALAGLALFLGEAAHRRLSSELRPLSSPSATSRSGPSRAA